MIVVFGSINLDLFTRVERLPGPGETVLGPRLDTAPGGKGANQALAGRRAGAPDVRLVARVGQDHFADPALSLLRRDGVDLGLVETCDEPTGCACIAIDAEGRNQIVAASGANRLARQDRLPDDWLGPATTLVLQMEVPAQQNWMLVRRAKAAGARVLLNVAPAAPVPEAVCSGIDILIVNEGEALAVIEALGMPVTDPQSAGAALAERSGTTVVVTLGADGSVAYTGDDVLRVPALKIDPVDTVAAGDAFVGALAAALDAGLTLRAALRRAAVAGSLACTRPGAQPSLPRESEIAARLPDLGG